MPSFRLHWSPFVVALVGLAVAFARPAHGAELLAPDPDVSASGASAAAAAAAADAAAAAAAAAAPVDPASTSTSTSTSTPSATATAEPPAQEVVVRGSKRRQAAAALAPGAAVTVVDATRFAGEAKGAGELLATAPGVAITDTGGLGRLATVSIRGASAEQVKVLLDGVPLNPVAGGGVDLSSIPSQWISRIEVIRGTEGVHHGTGALGGVVNVITTPPRAGSWSAGATAGSFGTLQADVQAGTGGKGWGLLGSLAASRSEGDFRYEDTIDHVLVTRRRNGSALAGGLLKGFALVGGGRLDAVAELSGGRRDLPGTALFPSPEDWGEESRATASARFRRQGPGGLYYTAAASTRLDRLVLQLRSAGFRDPIRQREVTGTGSLGADWCGDHGAASATVEAGAERLTGDGLGTHVRPVSALVLSGEVTAFGGRARLGPGVRLERRGTQDGVSAKLGGIAPIVGPLSVRASVGRTYRVPSFSELYLQQGLLLPNPDLRPEVGIGGDGGLVVEGAAGTASAGVFAATYRDLIVYQSLSYQRLRPSNTDRSLVRGLEAEVATVPWRRAAGLRGQAAYTYTESQVLLGKEEILGLDLPRKPRHRLYARLAVGGQAADAHVETQWISRQWLAFGRTAPVADALSFGAGAGVRLSRAAGLRLQVEVRNLLDVRTLSDNFGNPLPGRTLLVTLRADPSNPERP